MQLICGDTYPPIFQGLIGKKLLLKVDTKGVAHDTFYGTFQVRRICDDPTIIAMFELPDYDADNESLIYTNLFHVEKGDIGIKKESSKTFIKSDKVAGESSGILSKSPVLIDFLAEKQPAVFGGTEFAALINDEDGKDEKTPNNDTEVLSHVLDPPSQYGEKLIHENHVVTSKGKKNLNPQFEEAATDADGRGSKIAKVVLMLVILTMNVQFVGRVSGYQNVLKETLHMFAFTSLGGKVLDSVNDGSGPPQFIITGQNYHRIGSLLPDPGLSLSLHSYTVFYSPYNVQTSEIDRELITELLQTIDTHNVIAQSFRRVREFYQCHPSEIFSLKLYSHRKVDRRTYSAPSCDEVAALIVGDFDSSDHGRDIIVRFTAGQFQRIYETHALLYEIRMKQSTIRGEVLQGIEEAMRRGDDEASSIGTRVILPSSFTGGRRYMFKHCQDAMRFIEQERIPIADRPDISYRVFHAKLKCLLSDLKEGVFFGLLNAGMYTIEFQKRGLPHAHMLLWLNGESNLQNVKIVDEFICAELSNPLKFPALYNVITKYMIHGPCGRLKPSSPCMKDVKINDVDIDNRFVVPYNPLLLMKYQAHINLEFCNKSNVIKYLFKYVNKGPNRVTATVGETYHVGQSSQVADEIKQYYDCHYLSPSESMWRIFAYDIHHRWPSVQRLTFHLPNQQHVVFDDADITIHVYLHNKDLVTMFMGWMIANRQFLEEWSLTYVEYPCKFMYCSNSREWKPRQRGFSVGRLSFAHPSSGELFYMRMLLNVQRDDNEFVSAIKEVSELASAAQLRKLFVILLLSGSMGRPLKSQEELQTFCLLEIEKLLQSNGKSLRNYAGMPKVVYDKIIDCVSNKRHGFFFVYGFGGTRKTFLYRVLLAKLRSEKKIVINVASSGIASLLLPGGKTTHSMFNIPVELTEDTVCRIKKDSLKAEVVRLADLIIWDEAPMTKKLAFKAPDRMLRDIMVSVSDRNKDLPFGGKVVVLGGDFRQVLPVIPKGSRAEIVMASINFSVLWKYCEVLRLTKNEVSKWIGTINCSGVKDRAVLAPTVENVEEISNYIVDLLPGEEKNYLSANSICGSDAYSDVDVDWINVEFLNQIRCSGLLIIR
ncbi:uncharacterized protein LOC107633101 [Arachis ipaensis]|uniref:uncharacterized protein LOC107633101 n=1 Tax=Arachis ipaensis TaxID=130454 RepID=UPI0007AF276A|nr:uncharacterized protein LOC107633101 [Arachis ipaensis]